MQEKKINSTHAAAWTVLALLAASVEPIVVKMGYRGSVTPYQLLVIKTLVAALLIFPLTRRFEWIGWKGVAKVMSVSVLLLLNNLFSLMALKSVSAVLYLTLVTTNPAIIALVNSTAGKEKLNLRFWSGFFLCFAGIVLTLDIRHMTGSGIDPVGIALVLAAMACTIIYRTRMDKLTAEYAPMTVSLYVFWINAVMIIFFFVPWVGPIPAEGWKIGVWIGFAAALANIAFLSALHIMGSTRISIFNLLQRPLVIISASVILREMLTVLQIAGIVMVIAGTRLAKVERLRNTGEAEKDSPAEKQS